MNRLDHALTFSKKLTRFRNLGRLPETPVLYMLRCGGCCKFGIAGNVRKRLSSIQTSTPFAVTLVRYWSRPNPRDYELRVHSLLTKLGYHVRGEWFKIPRASMVETLKLIEALMD